MTIMRVNKSMAAAIVLASQNVQAVTEFTTYWGSA